MENKALGKGLSALISQAQEKAKVKIEHIQEKDGGQELEGMFNLTPQMLYIENIHYNPFQPRQNYDEDSLNELTASIKEKGILQPIMVRPSKDAGIYEVVMGERRLRASKKAGLTVIPAIIKEVSDSETLLLALIENIQRQDLNVIDEAKAFQRLEDSFHLSQDQIAQAVGKDRTTVANTLRLLKLPIKIQDQIIQEKISMGHARALLALNSEEAQLKMATQITEQSLSVRSVEGLVRQASTKTPNKSKTQKAKDPDITNLEDELRTVLGTKVLVEDKKGKGKLIIEYYTLDDLDRILEIIRGPKGV